MPRVALLTIAAATAALVAAAGASEPPRRAGKSVRVEQPRSRMAYVPGGSFTRGPTPLQMDEMMDMCREEVGDGDWCAPQQLGFTTLEPEEVHVDAFWIDRYEVTAGEFRACVSDGGCDVAALVAGDERYLEEEWPMVNVTWQDAADYCGWAGKRLPTEAEWEKAARGEDGRMWPWGNQMRADGSNHGKGAGLVEMAWTRVATGNGGLLRLPFRPDDSDGFDLVAPPGSLPWGESPYGVYDMAGNVSEWVQDYYAPGYDDLPQVNPVRDTPAGDRARVVRGGAWDQPFVFGITWLREPQLDRVRLGRPGTSPDNRSPSRGFRCARDS